MTRLPHESWQVTSLPDEKPYKVGPHCANPYCTRYADHVHHLWRRSFSVGDVSWVRLDFMDPPLVVGNLTGLCHACHDQVTRDIVDISWSISARAFFWNDADYTAALNPQPPRRGVTVDSPAADPPGDHGGTEVCPTCKRPKRKRVELPPGEKRRRKSWTVKVPDDNEDGAEVLDTLVDEIAERWGMDEFTSQLRRYHVLVPALVGVINNNISIEEG